MLPCKTLNYILLRAFSIVSLTDKYIVIKFDCYEDDIDAYVCQGTVIIPYTEAWNQFLFVII